MKASRQIERYLEMLFQAESVQDNEDIRYCAKRIIHWANEVGLSVDRMESEPLTTGDSLPLMTFIENVQ
jgi:hypothetical protein